MALDRLAIVGVGLIGGSVALAARRAGVTSHIVGIDCLANAPDVADVAGARVVDAWVDIDDDARVEEALSESDLTVLAMPVGVIASFLPRALAAGSVVTDCGSTKRALVERAGSLEGRERFIAGHPMAGRPQGGLANASADLFAGRRWLLCPEGAAPHVVSRVQAWVRALGAEPVLLAADAHDHAVALTSHVPQLVASALATLGAEQGASVAAGPAFASMTRVAGGAAAMWKDIFESNADAVSAELRRLGAELDRVASGLEQGRPDEALELLARARRALGRD